MSGSFTVIGMQHMTKINVFRTIFPNSHSRIKKNRNASHEVSINISINKEELCADLECSGVVQGCVGVMVIRTYNVNPRESGLQSSHLHTKAWET